jgi:hypothetical protein
MDVKEIVKTWLEQNGYDGLCDTDCGCWLKDLFPCESGHGCIPAYQWHCAFCNDPREEDGCWDESGTCMRPMIQPPPESRVFGVYLPRTKEDSCENENE